MDIYSEVIMQKKILEIYFLIGFELFTKLVKVTDWVQRIKKIFLGNTIPHE